MELFVLLKYVTCLAFLRSALVIGLAFGQIALRCLIFFLFRLLLFTHLLEIMPEKAGKHKEILIINDDLHDSQAETQNYHNYPQHIECIAIGPRRNCYCDDSVDNKSQTSRDYDDTVDFTTVRDQQRENEIEEKED